MPLPPPSPCLQVLYGILCECICCADVRVRTSVAQLLQLVGQELGLTTPEGHEGWLQPELEDP